MGENIADLRGLAMALDAYRASLSGKLHVESGDCRKATWARDAALPVPRLIPLEPADDEWAEVARAAARALPEYRKLQAEYGPPRPNRNL